ncbi:ficolin-1-like isoform X2 [Drosophila innubila]|nr:ficolin-1-like isoform X2 [Drosophila innubila]
MTADQSQELLVLLEDFEGQTKYEKYEKFAIGDELESYTLHTLGKASGTAGDSLTFHQGLKFSTFDRDNDPDLDRNCAVLYTGAWWYKGCHLSHLTGKYKDNISGKGINWYQFRGHEYSLKRAVMMIRPNK